MRKTSIVWNNRHTEKPTTNEMQCFFSPEHNFIQRQKKRDRNEENICDFTAHIKHFTNKTTKFLNIEHVFAEIAIKMKK